MYLLIVINKSIKRQTNQMQLYTTLKLLLIITSIQPNGNKELPCSDQFACTDGSGCIPKSKICNGFRDCQDYSHNFAAMCNNCTDDHLFKCEKNDESVCMHVQYKCNGIKSCNDLADELASECNNCNSDELFKCKKNGVDICLHVKYRCDGVKQCDDLDDELVTACEQCENNPSMFTCTSFGQNVCLSKDRYQCDGRYDCDDGSDEFPSVCDNCNQSGLAMCTDGSRCIKDSDMCNDFVDCADGSDESEIYCNHCARNNSFQCPGFPDNCGTLCDGAMTCPDFWDEKLKVCRSKVSSEKSICNQTGLFQCKDGSRCLPTWMLCDHDRDCTDDSDENSVACKDKCESKSAQGFPMLPCDNGSCILRSSSCSALEEPLCEDGADMADSLCNGTCYFSFPGVVDPYRWPCAKGIKKCILQIFRCDGNPDCDDGTEISFSSDEQNCGLATRVGLSQTIFLCFVIVVLSWLLFCMLMPHSRSIEDIFEDTIHTPSDQHSFSSSFQKVVPAFLHHEALSNMNDQCWNWQEVGEELMIEKIFFNKDSDMLFSFLYHIEAQDAHPDNVHNAFKGFLSYMTSKGLDSITVAQSMKKTIGHHRLAHMALKGPPNIFEKIIFDMHKCARDMEDRGKIQKTLGIAPRFVKMSATPFSITWDCVKDIVMYLILRGIVTRLEMNCDQLLTLGSECLVVSGIEYDLLTALLVSICVSVLLTSLNSFCLRKLFFETNWWLDVIFVLISPLLRVVYHLQLGQMKHKLDRQKVRLSNDDFRRRTERIETLSKALHQTKEIEVGLESVVQILVLLGLACFYLFVFKAPSGQSYSYFFGVALLVVKGNPYMFFVTLLSSFRGPCFLYANGTNVLRHGSLNFSRKAVLIVRNIFFLLVRVLVITSAIFIPVISQWGTFLGGYGDIASSMLDEPNFRLEFQKYFSTGLDALTVDIRKNAQFFGLFLVLHLFIMMASHCVFHRNRIDAPYMQKAGDTCDISPQIFLDFPQNFRLRTRNQYCTQAIA